MGRVIQADTATRHVVRVRVQNAHTEARRILEAAHEAADTIVAQAEARARAREGEVLALARSQAREELAVEHLRLAAARAACTAEAEQDLTTLALAASKHLLGRQLNLHPELICEIVRPLLAKLRHARSVVLRAHPDDAAALSRWVGSRVATIADANEETAQVVEVRADERMTRGGVWIHSDLGELDASVETRAAALERAWGLDACDGTGEVPPGAPQE